MNLTCNYLFTNPNEPQITVGDIFEARCKFDSAVAPDSTSKPINLEQLKVKFEEGKNYELVILRSAQSNEELNLALTSYQVGAKNFSQLVLSDGQQEISLLPALTFEVKSILKPDQKPEMFGPVSGLSVTIPLFYWALLGVMLSLFFTGLLTWVRKRWKRRQVLKRLAELDDGTLPLQQYFSGYRKIQRDNSIFSARSDSMDSDLNENNGTSMSAEDLDDLLKIVKTVEKALKLFLARTFRIDSTQMSWRQTLSELKKYHELVVTVYGAELSELSREFQKVGSGKNKLQAKDVISICEKSRKWVEKSDQLQKAILAKDTLAIKKLRGVR